jgi:hypothetical protein
MNERQDLVNVLANIEDKSHCKINFLLGFLCISMLIDFRHTEYQKYKHFLGVKHRLQTNTPIGLLIKIVPQKKQPNLFQKIINFIRRK